MLVFMLCPSLCFLPLLEVHHLMTIFFMQYATLLIIILGVQFQF